MNVYNPYVLKLASGETIFCHLQSMDQFKYVVFDPVEIKKTAALTKEGIKYNTVFERYFQLTTTRTFYFNKSNIIHIGRAHPTLEPFISLIIENADIKANPLRLKSNLTVN